MESCRRFRRMAEIGNETIKTHQKDIENLIHLIQQNEWKDKSNELEFSDFTKSILDSVKQWVLFERL